jgi:hypothetical protein
MVPMNVVVLVNRLLWQAQFPQYKNQDPSSVSVYLRISKVIISPPGRYSIDEI